MDCEIKFEPLPTAPEAASALASQPGEARPLVAVGMSGGVDSSTVAALLLEQGYRVVGLTMQLWDQRRNGDGLSVLPEKVEGRCCSGSDAYDARRVAERLGVPFYVLNFQSNFEQAVIQPFVAEYLAGRTPIPCTLCNNHVKFDDLMRTARQIGADMLATGHYARVRRDEVSGRWLLLRAADDVKDQTYFLFGLTQEQLARTLFPLGEMRKPQVRELAAQNELPVADKPESQEICFIPDGDYARFIERYTRQETGREQKQPYGNAVERGGEIVSNDGRVLSRHNGIENFTVGQRKGLGIATGTPLYVLALDAETRQVRVGHERELYAPACVVRDVNWISCAGLSGEMRVAAKIRHQHQAAPAALHPLDDGQRVRVTFDQPQRAITPGQAAVFYDGDIVVGGGWIESVG